MNIPAVVIELLYKLLLDQVRNLADICKLKYGKELSLRLSIKRWVHMVLIQNRLRDIDHEDRLVD